MSDVTYSICQRCLTEAECDKDEQKQNRCSLCQAREHMAWRAKNGLEDGDDYWYAMNDGWVE
jgi:hypothetical protein